MKKSLIICSLFLTTSFFVSSSMQAQEQKKPSERSFAGEINKVKQIQAARNAKVSQTGQPTVTATVGTRDTKMTTNNTSPAVSTKLPQQNTVTKPSTGPMTKPKRPTVTRLVDSN